MAAYWLPHARSLQARGFSLAEIGAAVGRSKVAVWKQLRGTGNGRRRCPKPPGWRASPEAAARSKLRRVACEEAAASGVDVEAIYARWGVTACDRSRLWDEKRGMA